MNSSYLSYRKHHESLQRKSGKQRMRAASAAVIENLEERRLLAAASPYDPFTYDSATQKLTVSGSSYADTVTVEASGTTAYKVSCSYVDGFGMPISASRTFSKSTKPISVVVFSAGNGADKFTNSTSIPCSVTGGDGNDTLTGGDGNDTLVGEKGSDTLNGKNGADRINGGGGSDNIYGYSSSGSSTSDGNNVLEGDGEDDIIRGSSGNDIIRGGGGSDDLDGSGGNDEIFGNDGDDVIDGNTGRDTLHGDAGYDELYASQGDETLSNGEHVEIDVPTDQPQDDDWSCGANSGSRLLRSYGIDVSYDTLRDEAEDIDLSTSLVSVLHWGTTPKKLQSIMSDYQSTSLETNADFSKVLDLLGEGRPVIALIGWGTDDMGFWGTVPDGLHYILLTGFDSATQTIYYTDTDGDQDSYSYDTFQDKWNWPETCDCSGLAYESLKLLGVKGNTILW